MKEFRLPPEVVYEPDDEAENDADDGTSDDWEIESAMSAAMDDIAGKASEAERKFAAKVEESADGDECRAKEKQRAAEVAEVHGRRAGRARLISLSETKRLRESTAACRF